MPTSSKGRIQKCLQNRRKLRREEGTQIHFHLYFSFYLIKLMKTELMTN